MVATLPQPQSFLRPQQQQRTAPPPPRGATSGRCNPREPSRVESAAFLEDWAAGQRLRPRRPQGQRLLLRQLHSHLSPSLFGALFQLNGLWALLRSDLKVAEPKHGRLHLRKKLICCSPQPTCNKPEPTSAWEGVGEIANRLQRKNRR